MDEGAVLCYALGAGKSWEAFCVQFDLAVQGTSFEEVQKKLHEQIELYLETVFDLPEPEREGFLRRGLPLKLRLNLFANMVRGLISRDPVVHRPREKLPFYLPVDCAQAA
jgi:hypothetical protein